MFASLYRLLQLFDVVLPEDLFDEPMTLRSTLSGSKLEQKVTEEEHVATILDIDAGVKEIELAGKGRAVMAIKDFKRGDPVLAYHGELIDLATAKERESKYEKNSKYGSFMYYFRYNDQSYCVDATKDTGRLGRLVNHSRANKNCVTKVFSIFGELHLILVAHRDIEVGEELLHDYGDRTKSSLKANPWLAI